LDNNIADKIRKHWISLALTLLIGTISVTWKVAHEIYIQPKSEEIERLNQRITELERNSSASKARETDTTKTTDTKILTIHEQSVNSEDNHLTDWQHDEHLFTNGNPYPQNHNKIKIGTNISVLKNIYPTAEFTSATQSWIVYLTDSPFSRIRFAVNNTVDSNDPEIIAVLFYFKDPFKKSDSKKYVVEQALKAFGTDTVVSKMLGEEMEWPSINGVKVKINSYSYIIAQPN